MSTVNGAHIDGASETMLQTLYARAKESQKPNHKIYDAKAMEIVRKLDYDFSLADKDAAMSTGVVARTIVLDSMVSDYVRAHPDADIVNIACGMDTRFYRVDNGTIRWYNIDLPDVMEIRERFIDEDGRVKNITASAMDESWTEHVPDTGRPVLVIMEGFSMYLNETDVRQILSIIDRHFRPVTIFMEILNPRFVHKDIEKSIQQSGAVFTWGAKSGKDIVSLCPSFRWRGDRSLVEGMEKIYPVYKVIGKIKPIYNLSNKIAVLDKQRQRQTNPV